MKSRLWAVSHNGLFKYVSVTDYYLKDILNLMRNGFFKEEYVSRTIGLNKAPEAVEELDKTIVDAIEDGVSLIAIEQKTEKVAAILLNRIMMKEKSPKGYFDTFRLKHPIAKQYHQINAAIDESLDCYEFLQTNCYYETMFGTVLPEFRKNNLMLNLLKASEKIAKCLKDGENVRVSVSGSDLPTCAKPNGIIAICTSPTAVKISKKLEFKTAKVVEFGNSLGTEPLAPISILYKLLLRW